MPIELPPELNPFSKLADHHPCWCRSGKSYAVCHKDRAKLPTAKPQQSIGVLRKQFKSKIGCLHPTAPSGCSGKIINSHTIQKSGPLKSIALNGEVYSWRGATDRIAENSGRLLPQRRGIATVSVFPGFCSAHDNEFFEPIENGIFELSPANCFLLHYRNVCSELHSKSTMQFGQEILELIDSGRHELGQARAQQFAADMNFGAALAKDELQEHREELSRFWIDQDFSRMAYYFLEFDKLLPFVASFAATPKFSFAGIPLQDWSDDNLGRVSVSSINFEGRSGFIFSSTDHDFFLPLVAELEDHSIRTPSNLLRWVVSNAENVAFEIQWWDNLSDRRRKHLLELALIGLPFGMDDELAAYNQAVEVLAPCASTRAFAF